MGSRPAVGAVGSVQSQIWPCSSLYLLSEPTVAPSVHSLRFVAGISSAAPLAVGVTSLPLPRSHGLWCSALVLAPPLLVGYPLVFAPCPDKMGWRLRLTRAHLLSQAGRGRVMATTVGMCSECLQRWRSSRWCYNLSWVVPSPRGTGSELWVAGKSQPAYARRRVWVVTCTCL